MQPIYLDFNSTAPLLPEVAVALADAYAAGYANPASQHAVGRRAHHVLEDTREQIACQLGADPSDQLLFTSGGTEANNLALFGLSGATAVSVGRRDDRAAPGRIIISSIEHPSITSAADELAHLGWQVDKLPVDSSGVVCLDHLDKLFAAEPLPTLVSVMLANNETGVLQPIPEIVRRSTHAGVPVHTDASQAIGKIPVNFSALGVTAMSVSPHKFHGPRGIGALLVQHGTPLQPLLHGATQQFGLRPGTESVALPIGFLAALRAGSTTGTLGLAGCRRYAIASNPVSAPLTRRRLSMDLPPHACRTPPTWPSSVTIARPCSSRSIWPASIAQPDQPVPAARANLRRRWWPWAFQPKSSLRACASASAQPQPSRKSTRFSAVSPA